jgi:hypothetical protein
MNSLDMNNVPEESIRAKQIARVITGVILILAAINGIFTYSGAHLFINEMLFAILFAVAVQFSIAISLIALPYVKGLGKIALLIVYAAALTLSTLSAYTFIYNSGLPGTLGDNTAVNVQLKARVSDKLGEAFLAEQTFIDTKAEQLAFLNRQAEEEALRGFRSGLGAGKGPEYYQKMELLQADEVRFEAQKRKYEEARNIYTEIDKELTKQQSNGQRENLILLLSRLKTVVITDDAKQIVTDISQNELGVIRSSVETAMDVILNRDEYSVQLIVSIVWAAVFDLLALFMGIIRYYILKPDYSVLSVIYDSIASFFTFIIRLGYIKKDVRQKYDRELQNQSHGTSLNSNEMQSFATYIMAGSLFSATGKQDAIEPLQNLISHIEPLKLASDPSSVGIPFDVVDEHQDMKTLMAMLIKNEVFLANVEHNVYIMNPGSEMAQKLLVFIKMGIKDSNKQDDISRFNFSAEANIYPINHSARGN